MQAATHPLPKLVLPALLAAMLFAPGAGAGQDRIGTYDFSYQLTGDARARPVHVFDDGKDTFFQFRTGEPVPAIFLEGAAGAQLLVPQTEGPYVKVAALSDGFALRLGFGVAKVAYIGGVRRNPSVTSPAVPSPLEPNRRPEAAPSSIRLPAAQTVAGLPREMPVPTRPRIALEEGSYATPLKGDAVGWMMQTEPWREHPVAFGKDSALLTPTAQKLARSVVAAATPGARFEVIGHDDAGHKESLAEARSKAMVAAGAVPASIHQTTTAEVKEAGKGLSHGVTLRLLDPGAQRRTSLQPGKDRSQPALPARARSTPVWAVRKSDATVERMLERWARDAGWTLVWQGGPTVAITGDATLSRPDYLQAADYVVNQVRAAGHRLQATAYSNQTLVITEE